MQVRGEEEIATRGIGGPSRMEIPALLRSLGSNRRGQASQQDWQASFDAFAQAQPDLAGEFTRRMVGKLPANWSAAIDSLAAKEQQTLADLETVKVTTLHSHSAVLRSCLRLSRFDWIE